MRALGALGATAQGSRLKRGPQTNVFFNMQTYSIYLLIIDLLTENAEGSFGNHGLIKKTIMKVKMGPLVKLAQLLCLKTALLVVVYIQSLHLHRQRYR